MFTPRDKLAKGFEAYAESMELNVWTGTELVGTTYDDQTGQWTATVRREGGNLHQSRHYSTYSTLPALKIKAIEEGLLTGATL